MRAAMIGDNCIDDYPKLGKRYPTGNCVDTGVNLHKLGVPTAIISTTGSDENGKWMLDTLGALGLDLSHLKVGDGATAITYMDMNGLDRVHGDYIEGVMENIEFTDEDVRFACQHDLVHTALWGNAEKVLPDIAASGVPVSFDYADEPDNPLWESTLPYVTYGFYSWAESREKAEAFLKDKVARGQRMKVAVTTFGEEGSLAWDGQRFYEGGVFPSTVVNTIGAGDSYIAGFLYGILNGWAIEKCMEQGAKVAAEVVGVFGPWVD